MTSGVEISGTDIALALGRAAERLVARRDELNALDAALGDGDSGLTAEKGARALQLFLAERPPEEDLGPWLMAAGAAYNRGAPSTMGALIATGFMRAGQIARGRSSLNLAILAQMLRAADEGIQARGKSAPGDKTILDALNPTATALTEALQTDVSIDELGACLLDAARTGRDNATALRSRVGRAGWIGERTEGKPDPGTVLFVAALEGVLNAPASPAMSS